MDLELTGVGPRFQTEIIIDSPEEAKELPHTIITFTAHLKQEGERHRIEYSVGARIPLKTTGNGKGAYNIEFRDIILSGNVVVKADETLVLSKVNGHELTLKLSKAK